MTKSSEQSRTSLVVSALLAAVVASVWSGYYGSKYGQQSAMVVETDAIVVGIALDISGLQKQLSELQAKVLATQAGGSDDSDEIDETAGDDATLTLGNVQKEYEDMVKQIANLEQRISAEEKDTEEERRVSEIEMAGPKNPTRDYIVPKVMIEFRGRTLYTMKFEIRINKIDGHWRNVFHLGDVNTIRSPAIWTYGNQRRLHIRQGGEYKGGSHWNWGCDADASITPALNQYFTVDILAKMDRFEIEYNGQHVCGSNYGVLPPAGQQRFYFSDPWHHAAMVTVKNLKFAIQ